MKKAHIILKKQNPNGMKLITKVRKLNIKRKLSTKRFELKKEINHILVYKMKNFIRQNSHKILKI